MRGATYCIEMANNSTCISIHAPHAGRDYRQMFYDLLDALFQPSRPMRGATDIVAQTDPAELISIHAPHAGRD